MSVSADTYIVISLMFAVFAAVAAVGTSVVLGAGFERLRAGFDHIKRQSGFFADAIYKLDQRTQKLDEETAKLKAGISGVYDRVDRVEKQTTFMADAVNSMEQRILQGSPAQPSMHQHHDGTVPPGMNPVHTVGRAVSAEQPKPRLQMHGFISLNNPVKQQEVAEPRSMISKMFDDEQEGGMPAERTMEVMNDNEHDSSGGISTLLSRYFTGDNTKGVIYH